MNKGGGARSKFSAYYDNVIIEGPLNIILLSMFFTCELFSEKKFQRGNQLGQKKKVNKRQKEYF